MLIWGSWKLSLRLCWCYCCWRCWCCWRYCCCCCCRWCGPVCCYWSHYIKFWSINVHLRLLKADVEFLWWWWWVCTVFFVSNPTTVLRLCCWLCCVVVGVVTTFVLFIGFMVLKTTSLNSPCQNKNWFQKTWTGIATGSGKASTLPTFAK